MLNLSNFYEPLNVFNILFLISFIFICDVIGLRLIYFFIKDIKPLMRGSAWLIGLGIITFIYFLLHFFVSYNNPIILFVIAGLFFVSIRWYLNQKSWIDIFNFVAENKIVFVLILIVFPKVFVKSSLPPYMWDEMAYHFVSPYTLVYEKTWVVANSFYQNLPRLLETAYILMFSITKTYSLARILHFSIFITFVLIAYSFIKSRLGRLPAIVFSMLTLYYPENFLLWSTFGYIDAGTTSFVLIGFIYLLEFVITSNKNFITVSLGFIGMAIGSKYSALTQFVSCSLLIPIMLILKKSPIYKNLKYIYVGLFMSIVLGGYWYIKNFIVTGNPIFPFLFGCKFDICETASLSYTLPFNVNNASQIYSQIFLGNKLLKLAIPTSAVLTFIFGSKITKNILFFVITFIFIEIMAVRFVSGYDARYFYHWPILAMLVLVLPLHKLNLTRKKLKNE